MADEDDGNHVPKWLRDRLERAEKDIAASQCEVAELRRLLHSTREELGESRAKQATLSGLVSAIVAGFVTFFFKR